MPSDLDALLAEKKTAAELATILTLNKFSLLRRPVKEWFDRPEIVFDAVGIPHFAFDTNGALTEANSAAMLQDLEKIKAGLPLCATAGGQVTTITNWYKLKPVVVTAAADGSLAAAAIVVPPQALKGDCVWTCQVSISGLYKLDFIENTAAPAAPVPDYHSTPVSVYMVAGFPYTFYIENTANATNLGVNALAAGSWPNNAVMAITPMVRSV